jgi:LPS export ABC transporter protein LptC
MLKLILSLLIITNIAFLGFGKRQSPPPKISSTEEIKDVATESESDQKILTFNLAGFDEAGRKKWEIEGRSASFFGDLIKLDGVVTKAYGKEDSLTLTADEGTYDKANNRVHLEKNVVAISESGAKLTTNSLDWDANLETVTTEDYVKVEKDNLESAGTGAVGQPNLKTVQLNEDVTVNIYPKQGTQQPTVITCKGPLVVDYQNNIATFNEEVKVKDKEGEIYSDKMDVYFTTSGEPAPGGETKQMKIIKIVCIGNVKIVRGENISFSQEAVYTTSDRKVILTGEPKLVIYSSEEGKPNLFGEEEEK